MANFEFNGKSFYIDNNLKRQLDNNIIPELSKEYKDILFVIDGKERSGKSKFGDILGVYAAICLKTKYGIDNICMTPEEFKKRVENANNNDVVIYDEAHRGMGSRRSLSEINNILVDLMMEMGQKNLFVIIILPTFFMLDKYPALYRARGLFHVYERKHKRGFWVYFNERDKLKLYRLGKKEFNYNCMHYPKFRGRFFNQYAVDKKVYIEKKKKSFENRIRLTRAETFKHDRDIVLYAFYKEMHTSERNMIKTLKKYGKTISKGNLSEILSNFNKNEQESEGEQSNTMVVPMENDGLESD
jgi:hypothetical protein